MSSNVLIVEDEALVALELRENVERLGHEVIEITDNAERAVSLALKNRPDLVIMDVRLSGKMDGIEAASVIRRSADIPVVFLTAYSGDEMLTRATQSGPYGYLLKPVQERQLESAIRVAMHRHRRDSRLRESYREASTILRALPNAVVVTDNSLVVRYVNASAERLLHISIRDSVGKPLSSVVKIGDINLARDSMVGFDEVLDDGRSVDLGEHTLHLRGASAGRIGIEVSPLIERSGVIIGALVNLREPRGDRVHDFEEGAVSNVDNDEPLIGETGDLRSYLEVEIVRLSMNESDLQSDPESERFRDGQIDACKRILKFMFGEDALQGIEEILPVDY